MKRDHQLIFPASKRKESKTNSATEMPSLRGQEWAASHEAFIPHTPCVTFYEHCALRLGALTFANLLINTNDHSGLHSRVYHVQDLISSS